MTQQQLNQIADMQNKYNNCISLMRFDEYYLAISKDAETVAKILKTKLQIEPTTHILYTKLSIGELSDGLQRLVRAGHKVAIADQELTAQNPKPKKSKVY